MSSFADWPVKFFVAEDSCTVVAQLHTSPHRHSLIRLSELPLLNFGRLFHILYYGYLGQTFGPLVAKRHLCYNVLC
jgi:hypothetical protein